MTIAAINAAGGPRVSAIASAIFIWKLRCPLGRDEGLPHLPLGRRARVIVVLPEEGCNGFGGDVGTLRRRKFISFCTGLGCGGAGVAVNGEKLRGKCRFNDMSLRISVLNG